MVDANGVTVVGDGSNGVKNPDGSITYTDSDGGVLVSKPDGSTTYSIKGITTSHGPPTPDQPLGPRLSVTSDATGQPASASDIQAASQSINGNLVSGRLWDAVAGPNRILTGVNSVLHGNGRTGLEQIKTATEGGNLVNIVTGKQAPGFNNNGVNSIIDKGLGGNGQTFGGQPIPGGGGQSPIDTSILPNLSGGGGAGATDPGIAAAAANSQSLGNKYSAAYDNFQPTAAPVAQAAQLAPTVQAQQQAAIQYQNAQAAQIAAYQAAQQGAPVQAGMAQAGQATPAQIAANERAQASLAARTVLGPTALASQTQIAPVDQATRTQLAPTALSQSANIDTSQEAQFRADQRGLVSGLQGTIAGTDPSVAALMLRQATDRNIANQYALAQSANGNQSGIALRQAMIGSSELNQQAIGQQALLRAQEIATARGQLGGVLDQGRTQDLNLAQGQAGLQQQTALANQSATNTGNITQLGADVQTKLANAGFVNTQNMTQAQLNQAIQLANAGFKNNATTTQAQLDAATTQLNAQLQTGVSQFNAGQTNTTNNNQAGLTNAANIANAGFQTQASTTNANNTTSANTASATLANQIAIANANNQSAQNIAQGGYTNATNIANAGNQLQAGMTSAQLANAVAIANANNSNSANIAQGGYTNAANIANASNQIQQQSVNQTGQQNAAANSLTASGQQVTAAAAAASAAAERAKAQATQNAAYIGAGSAAVGALFSDRRGKTDIAPAEAEIAEFVAGLKPYGFKYRDPSTRGAAPGQRYGIMAQDLERSKVGRTLVRDREDGTKEIDVGQSVGAILAAISSMNSRVEHMEGRR